MNMTFLGVKDEAFKSFKHLGAIIAEDGGIKTTSLSRLFYMPAVYFQS